MLHNVGLAELVADSQDSYVRIARELATDLPRLRHCRLRLRSQMRASPLMDEVMFTRNLESAYRDMWRTWCKSAEESGIAELQAIARGLWRDRDAVEAAVATARSNGQTEGQVNRLKTTKRAIYGRAKFDLLRQRILHAA